MSINFPNSPSINDLYTFGTRTWRWSGSAWDLLFSGTQGYTGSQGTIGYTGSQGGVGFTGSQGLDGSIGFTGSRGSTGFTGSAGTSDEISPFLLMGA
jgi:hypothetical protein